MEFKALECVVLTRDLPGLALRRGDLGTVLELYEPDELEVEFVKASGETQALVLLRVTDVRKVGPEDIVSVRPLASQHRDRGAKRPW